MPLIAFDYKSFHVLTLGFEAQDARYIRMARMDMHSFFALVGLLRIENADALESLPDEELAMKLKWFRKQSRIFPEFGGRTFQEIRDQKAKTTILAIGFGMKEFTMYQKNPESFHSPSDAKETIDALNGLFPKPEQWRQEIRMKADHDHQLVSRYGYVRRFWDVYHRRPVAGNYQPRGNEKIWEHKNGTRWLLTPGDDGEAAIAFLPANDAFGMIRSRMVEVGESGLDDKFGLINNIHDSLVFDCRGEHKEECLWKIKNIMERPSEVLVDPEVAPGGLWCQVEAKIGDNLRDMREVKI
jgi:hypothetical protein